MKTRLFFLLGLFFLLNQNGTAQIGNSMDARMRDFLNTPFMEQYQKIQLKMTKQVRIFMAEQGSYTPVEIQKVKESYQTTSQAFNDVLLSIKKDFTDRKTRKIIKQAPDLYHARLDMQMNQLKDTYATNFLQTLSDVKGEQIDGGLGFLIILTEWTKFTFQVVDFFTQLRWKNAMFNDAFLRDRLIKPYSFPTWDMILMQNTPGMMGGGMDGMPPDMMMGGGMMNGGTMNGGVDPSMMGGGMNGEVNPNGNGMPPGSGGF